MPTAAESQVGLVSKLKTRPAYPDFTKSIVHSLYRIVLTSFMCCLFHHFIMCTFVAPLLLSMVKSSFVQNLTQNSAVQWYLGLGFFANKLKKNDQTVDDVFMYYIGATFVHLSLYFVINGFFELCDRFQWLQEYRIPVQDFQRPSRELKLDTLKEQFIQTCVSSPLTFPIFVVTLGAGWNHTTASVESLTKWDAPFHHQVLHFMAAHVVNEVLFYFAHRAFHEVNIGSVSLYKTFHKTHHKYIGAIGISAEYANPVEALFANFLPTVVYLMYASRFGVPIMAFYSFLAHRLIETFEAHSGFDFRPTFLYQFGLLQSNADWHCFHHSKNQGNYGTFGLDYIFGTQDYYVADRERPECSAMKKYVETTGQPWY